MELIRPFDHLGSNDVNIAGGKGASLGEMTQAGIPVPPGFVILTDAFEQFLNESDLRQDIEAILMTVNKDAIHTVEHASEKIQNLLHAASMPEDIAAEIRKYFKNLDAEFVAVRSSATAEDGAAAAWAGQLDTYLNTTKTELLTNVQRCWASLFTPRAIFYRFEKGMGAQKISVAVVVQKMVQSEVSGIAFSVHPVTEDRNQMIIEAGFGLGEAIVSGQVTPNSYVVTKVPRVIIDKNICSQARGMFQAVTGGNEWRDIETARAGSQALSDVQILELADMVAHIEAHYGLPCDIEWVYEGGKFYITQSRPITTLSEASGAISKITFKKSYSRDTTLFMQALWAKGLLELPEQKFGLKNPHTPFIAHRVHEGVVEIWEHEPAIRWLLDTLSVENKKGITFLENVLEEYTGLLSLISSAREKRNIDVYRNLIYKAAFNMTLFLYTGMDERSPEKAKNLAVHAREIVDFFADNDAFVRAYIAERAGITPEQAGVVLAGEVSQIPSIEILDQRLSSYLLIDGVAVSNEPLESFVWQHPEYLFRSDKQESMEMTSVNGETAYPGRVRGVVRLVRKQADMARVQSGDILVSPMTTPDFMPAMQRAAAFVTDEGGVTCHAAIVAREIKKPCIIATKIATQVLADGDVVEVDADNGIVRIIEKS